MEPATHTPHEVRIGYRPVKLNSVIADVLAQLLRGERLTGLDTVRSASTTRLAAVIYNLENTYGWHIERQDIAVGCQDGRVAWVREYWLAPEVIALAAKRVPPLWCHGVSMARKNRRRNAIQAHLDAARINAERQLNLNLD